MLFPRLAMLIGTTRNAAALAPGDGSRLRRSGRRATSPIMKKLIIGATMALAITSAATVSAGDAPESTGVTWHPQLATVGNTGPVEGAEATLVQNHKGVTDRMGAAAKQNWPEAILIPTGFEAEGIELGKGHEFFVGGFSFSSVFGEPFFGIPHETSEFAGAIYKGNLRTGKGDILVPPTGQPVAGLSYDRRTDYLYAATGFVDLNTGSFTDQGVIVYDATSGDLITEIGFGGGIVLNDVLVTRTGVYVTDSLNANLYKLVLEKGGRLPSTPVVEMIPMSGFEIESGDFNANGLVGSFDGRQLVIVNTSTGVLYLVDTASGEASPLKIEGAEQLFVDGDGLYLNGRTLYILQNFSYKIAVVQLSGDLSAGEFIRNIPGEGEINPLDVATTLIGFGNSLYAINTHFFDLIFGDPALVQTEVVRLRK